MKHAIASNARGLRKDIRKQFARHFDPTRLDYRKRTAAARPKAILYGVASAAALYAASFAAMYVGWSSQALGAETFSRLVWIIMLPTTGIGVLVGQIVRSRLEYPVREDIRRHLGEIEGATGLLWRYGPLLTATLPDDLASKKILALSQQGKHAQIDIEDYLGVLEKLNRLLDAENKPGFETAVWHEVAENLRFDT